MPTPTASEQYFEEWCRSHRITCQTIKKARVDGYRRPDFAINVSGHWCIVEMKQIDPNPHDKNLLEEIRMKKGEVSSFRPEPGSRLIRGIRSAARQLHRFSMRGLPTVVCFFDNTIGFYDRPRDVQHAMARVKTDIIRAIAVLRDPTKGKFVVDLFHYCGARVPISPCCAADLVRKTSCR